MEKFNYRKSTDILALSASMTDFTYKKHCHEEYAIGVTLRGIQQYNLDGSFQSSHKNGVMLFNPEQSHDGRSYDKSGIEYVMLYIKPDLFLEISKKKELVNFSSPIIYDASLAQCILSLSHAIQNGKEESLCNELLLTLVDYVSNTEIDTPHRKNNKLVKKTKEMMFGNIENVLKLDDLCKEFDLSKYQFIREFKTYTGISPYQFFLNCKVEHAKHSIEKNKDIYLAVAECGFVDLTHMNRHFKSVFGITPYEYMSQLN
ncbi:AraC family transcriptional regulator [Paenibacillus crassostreae]|uniref:AraC family transcriptional regulator n=1 Tax=Paenibacillus crassostreae TaxID=1763538 RepID=A0A167DP65_9BACL|nr:AraC family transcriptional regulator [Paenibacillus crassostreae]AOZ91225.1 AraC family transcriptional regulator [Paenibacillus crassostreae]OAB74617.1 AraC family transcriptional regulator [Paenibacillus crassostreae]